MDDLRALLLDRYPARTPPIGFYPLPEWEVAPGRFTATWRCQPTARPRVGLVYVHVPFCRQRCAFCRFYPGPHGDDRAASFVDTARRELDWWAAARAATPDAGPVAAVFVGGGTPSSLRADQLGQLLGHLRQAFDVRPAAEVTVEWYPKDADADKLAAGLAAGMTRVSSGVQSWEPATLRGLGAHHDGADVDAVLRTCAEAGVANLNIDLMANAPGQSLAQHLADVDRAVTAGAAMVSVNMLELADGSPLAAHGATDPPAGEKRRWLAAAAARLGADGFEHQRVRNFHRHGRLHRYNRASTGIAFDIVPIGPGAYGFVGGWPVINAISFQDWQARVHGGGPAVVGCAEPSDDERRRAFVVNSLLELAVDPARYRDQFDTELFDDFPVLATLATAGVFVERDGELRLDGVAAEFGDDIAAEVFSAFQRRTFSRHLHVGRRADRSQYFPTVRSR